MNFTLIRIGAWDLNPYLSFTVSALVELAAYVIVHLILDRIGRKIPYCLFAILFGIVALLVLPIQGFMTKNSRGLLVNTKFFKKFFVYFSSDNINEYN